MRKDRPMGLPGDKTGIGESVDVRLDEISINETYPFNVEYGGPTGKKMVIYATIRPRFWHGEEFKEAKIQFEKCCDHWGEVNIQDNNIPAGGRLSENFLKVFDGKQIVDKCPFCGAEIEVIIN